MEPIYQRVPLDGTLLSGANNESAAGGYVCSYMDKTIRLVIEIRLRFRVVN